MKLSDSEAGLGRARLSERAASKRKVFRFRHGIITSAARSNNLEAGRPLGGALGETRPTFLIH